MHPDVKKIRLKMTNTGEKRVAYSPKELVTMIRTLRSPWIPLAELKSLEEAGMIPPSIFVWGEHFYTLRQIHLVAAWLSGQLPQNVNPQTYLYEHWSDPDPKEEGA